ncbi:MAG: N-formylglutamate amidohydrolase [Celeribacter sp.]
MTQIAYRLLSPATRNTSVVFSSPHSGRVYPEPLMGKTILDELSIRSSEDAYVDELFGHAPEVGAPLLAAVWPRAWLDLNRAADELDPAVIDGVRSLAHNPRVSSGLGVIPRVVSNGRAIYRGKLTLAEARARIADGWHPYHRTLQSLLDESRRLFGEAILIDCHSMPHEAIEAVSPSGRRRPDVVLGDRFGAAATQELVEQVEAIFTEAGLHVARNAPFAGAYITQNYGRPSRRQHAIQIEIDRGLYLDERNVTPGPNFDAFRDLMREVTVQIAALGRPAADAMPLAAE